MVLAFQDIAGTVVNDLNIITDQLSNEFIAGGGTQAQLNEILSNLAGGGFIGEGGGGTGQGGFGFDLFTTGFTPEQIQQGIVDSVQRAAGNVLQPLIDTFTGLVGQGDIKRRLMYNQPNIGQE